MKYIVDIDDFEPLFKVDSIGVFGIGKSVSDSDNDHSWSRIKSIEEFEELNSDYINEHFGDLQDTAYQRGLDDAWEAARKIIRMSDGDILDLFPDCYASVCTAVQAILKYDASEAIAKLKAYEEKQKTDDKIEVGDEVERYLNGEFDSKGIYLGDIDEGVYCKCLFWTGVTFSTLAYPKEQFKKTGRHFDISSILKEMQND